MEFYAPIALALPANRRRMQVFEKARRSGIPDLVTTAEIETQRQLKTFALQNGWQFWGEEGQDNSHRYDEAKKYLMIADPIEGTNNYVHRKDDSWGSVVALVDIRKREPVAGIVAHPSRKAFYAAAKGEGAYLLQYDSSDRLVSQRAMDRKPELPFFTYNNSPHFSPQLARQARRFMSLGKVKANYFKTSNEMAAVFVILAELGGKATDAAGKPWQLGISTMISARKAGDYGCLTELYAKTCG